MSNTISRSPDDRIIRQIYYMVSAKGLSGQQGLELAEDLYEAGYRPIGGLVQQLRHEEEPYEVLYYSLKKELEDLWNG